MNNPIIRVENMSKKYNLGVKPAQSIREAVERFGAFGKNTAAKAEEFWALRDVSLNVNRGEVVGIIGKNGAGKSTLLKILSKITEPTSGRAILKGRVASLLEVGTGFHPDLTGRENIYLNGAILGMRKREIDKKLDEIIDFSEIENFLDTPVKRYSSGMYVRLAFAVAAHLDPEILLIDEVLAVGDAGFQRKCLGKMDKVAESGRTILFVSHNMSAVQSLCSKVYLIEHGRLASGSNPGEVIGKYLSEETVSRKWSEESRKGNGPIRFKGLKILNSLQGEAAALRSGEKTTLRMEYESSVRKESKGVVFHVFCVSPALGRVFTCSTRYAKGPESLPFSGTIDCVIPKLPLRAGSYYLQLVVKVDEVLSDMIENAGALNVMDGDFYGSGRNPSSMDAVFLVDHEWKVV